MSAAPLVCKSVLAFLGAGVSVSPQLSQLSGTTLWVDRRRLCRFAMRIAASAPDSLVEAEMDCDLQVAQLCTEQLPAGLGWWCATVNTSL